MYLMQLSRDGLYNKSFLIKTTSDISKRTKFSILLLNNVLEATTSSRSGGTTFMKDVYDVASAIDRKGFTIPWRIYTNIYWSQTARDYNLISAKISKLVNPQTFYEIQLQNFTIFSISDLFLRCSQGTFQNKDISRGFPRYSYYLTLPKETPHPSIHIPQAC